MRGFKGKPYLKTSEEPNDPLEIDQLHFQRLSEEHTDPPNPFLLEAHSRREKQVGPFLFRMTQEGGGNFLLHISKKLSKLTWQILTAPC